MADFFAIAANLLTLEINTVLKDGMSSQKMPSSEDAVIDTIEIYCIYLSQLISDHDSAEYKFVGSGVTSIDPDGLDRLRTIAQNLRTLTQQTNETKAVLSRIQRTCDQMKDFVTARVSRQAPLRLTAEQTILLRKAWEIGTETVVMQTVIQIDGDVVTRIHPDHQTSGNAALHEAHRQSVDLSFRYWQFLVDTLGRMANAAVRDLLR